MTAAPDDPIWDELPDGCAPIEQDGEVVGVSFPDDLELDALNLVLDRAGFPKVQA